MVFQLEEDKIVVCLVAGGIGILGLAIAFRPAPTPAQLERKQDARELAELRIRAASVDERAAIANELFSKGCIPVVSGTNPNATTVITQGQPVLDPNRPGANMAPGSVVCDWHGNIAVIGPDQLAMQPAWTGDRKVVEAAFEIHGLRVNSTQPVIQSTNPQQEGQFR